MKKVILFCLVLMACQGNQVSGGNLSAEAFRERQVEGLPLLDVRTPEEFAKGRLSGALNMNIKATDFEAQLEALDKSKPYLVYCASGVRSDRASQLMKEKGFTEVYVLDGGIHAWEEKGFEVEEANP